MNPFDNPEAFDYAFLGNNKSPLCKVSGFGLASEWDIKRGKGTKGATFTYTGSDPTKGKIVFFAWDAETYDAMLAFLPLLEYDPTKKKIQAVDIVHPQLAAVRVTSVITNHIGQPERETEDGLWSVSVDLIHYVPASNKNATGTPNSSATTTSGNGKPAGNVPPTAQDAQQKEIEALLKKAREV